MHVSSILQYPITYLFSLLYYPITHLYYSLLSSVTLSSVTLIHYSHLLLPSITPIYYSHLPPVHVASCAYTISATLAAASLCLDLVRNSPSSGLNH
jgi:hypothetical protein